MTREEQKAVRELKNLVKKALKPSCKIYRYKTISDCAYKVVNDYIYILYVYVPPISGGKYITAKLSVKPILIDTIFWEVYEMLDDVKGKPFSFHISSAHTPYSQSLEKFETPVSSVEDVILALENIFKKTDILITRYSKRFSSLSIFKSEICNGSDSISRLNSVLCDIAEKNYQEALTTAQKELDSGESGGFSKLCENGLVSIYSYIIKYCKEKV